MRKLMWFSVGFAAASAVGAYLLSGMWLVNLAILFALPAVVLLIWKRAACTVVAVVLLGMVTGLLYYAGYDQVFLSDAKSCDGEKQWIHMEAADYSFNTGYGFAVDGRIQRNGKDYAIRLYFSENLDVAPGDHLEGIAQLRYTASGGAQNSTYHKGEGVFLLAYSVGELEYRKAETVPARYFPAVLRKNISQRISELFPEDTAGFAKALLLGDDSQISFRENMEYQKSGIRHVIAVSGLHVSILFSVVYFVTGRKNLLTLLLGLPVLLIFCAVAGFSPSVVRACIMQALVILSMAVNKEYDPGTSLAFAALVMLLVNPLTVTSVSFQLSVGSMMGIFLFSGSVSRYLLSRKLLKKYNDKSVRGRLMRGGIKSVSVTVSAMVITLPLCALYFGMISVVSLITNLITLWIVSFVFYGIIISCLLSLIWTPAGTLVAFLVSWLIRYIQLAAKIMSGIPGGVAYTDSPYAVLWVVASLVLILLFVICKRKSPVLLTAAISIFYALSLLLTWFEPYLDDVQLTVLDVGQGQCLLLQSKDQAYLLDCGGENPEQVADAVIQALGANGIHSLDGIILTHYDKDHANGAVYVIQTVPVERLYLPDTEADSEIRIQLEMQNVPISWIRHREKLDCGSGELKLYPSEISEEGNESSMCILYQSENCAILVTGDRDLSGEKHLLEQGIIPKLDVLVVGHHGAYSSTGWELLKATQPNVAVICVGKDNLHGHPDPYTLDRLERFGCIVRRTDYEGTFEIRG